MSNEMIICHLDLDGYGSGIILEKVFPNYRQYICNYNFEDNEEMANQILNSSVVIIADLSVSANFATKMNDRVKSGKMKALLLDHHDSADKELSPLGFDWIHIDQSKSGTLLCYDYFKDCPELNGYREFAENISDYDLWQFKKPYSKTLQFLWSSDKSGFTKKFLTSPKLEFSDKELAIISESYTALNNTYNFIINDMTDPITDKDGLKFRVVSRMERLASLALSRVLDEYKDTTDYLVIFNQWNNSISFRSQSYVQVNKIAESLGGGGHPQAAGAPFTQLMDLVNSVIQHKIIMIDPMKRN